MTAATQHRAPLHRIHVYQKSTPLPDWVQTQVAEAPAPNGTFLLRSEHGQARVHPGNVIFEYKGHVYACPHSEVQSRIAELEDRFAPVPEMTKPAPQLLADVAPMDDVTDDITIKIRAQQGNAQAAPERRPAPVKPVAVARYVEQAAITRRAPSQWPAAKGMPPSIENRHPSELNIDDSYQRSTDTGASQALIKKIANGWDWRMCMPLVVSKRDDGSLWVIDGLVERHQARASAAVEFLASAFARPQRAGRAYNSDVWAGNVYYGAGRHAQHASDFTKAVHHRQQVDDRLPNRVAGAIEAASLYKGFCGKLKGTVLRLALVSELLTWADSGARDEPAEISAETIVSAIEFAETYAKPTALRVFGDAALPPVERNAAALGRFILKKPITMLNARETRRACGIPALKDAVTLGDAIDFLVDADWLRPAPTRANDTPGRQRADYLVNPQIYEAAHG